MRATRQSSHPERAAAAAKSLQSCPILWDPRDGSSPGSPGSGFHFYFPVTFTIPQIHVYSSALQLCSHHYTSIATAAAKSLQSCPTLCDPIDSGPPGSPVPGILQARTLEWVAISFSNAWKGKVKVKLLSRVQLFVTPWSAAYQAPPSIGFSRQEYWSRVPLPSPYTSMKPSLLCAE